MRCSERLRVGHWIQSRDGAVKRQGQEEYRSERLKLSAYHLIQLESFFINQSFIMKYQGRHLDIQSLHELLLLNLMIVNNSKKGVSAGRRAGIFQARLSSLESQF